MKTFTMKLVMYSACLLGMGCGATQKMAGMGTKPVSAASTAGKRITGFEVCIEADGDKACSSTRESENSNPEYIKIASNSDGISVKLRALTGDTGKAVKALAFILSMGSAGDSNNSGNTNSNSQSGSSSNSSQTTTTTTNGVTGMIHYPGCGYDPYGRWLCAEHYWWNKYCRPGYFHPYYTSYYCGAVIPGQTTTTTTTENSSSNKNNSDNSSDNEYTKIFANGDELDVQPILAGATEFSDKAPIDDSKEIALMPALVELDSFSESKELHGMQLCVGASKAQMVCTDIAGSDGEWVKSKEFDLMEAGAIIVSAKGR